jgi:pimeloyl-ACP methyl ester carboxylesterase
LTQTEAPANAPTATPAHAKSHTYVLVHGAWHGGWCWEAVAQILRSNGHRVFTPTLSGLGERSNLLSPQIDLQVFIQDVVDVLEQHDLSDVILVGHSFGGISIAGAADRVPQRIRQLVFLDAVVLSNGETAFSRLPPEIAAARRQLALETSNGTARERIRRVRARSGRIARAVLHTASVEDVRRSYCFDGPGGWRASEGLHPVRRSRVRPFAKQP